MTQQPINVLAQQLTMRCLDGSGTPRPIEVSFTYDPTDPYAVWITFHSVAGDVTWAVARSVISRGMFEPTGEGDIQVWPSVDEDGHAVVMFEFCSPDGELVAHLDTEDVHAFITRTQAVVPFGAEPASFDVDAMISALLSLDVE
jgi:hypothetical protein